jgi:DNA-binding NtrC family response regulator
MKNSDFKILIVDDEVEFRKVVKTILVAKKYDVDHVCNAEMALGKIKNNKYHLVLTDLVMPEKNGLELLDEIKAYDQGIEVIIVTGYGSIDNAVNAMKKGAFSYYIKSNSPDKLLKEIRKLQKTLEAREKYLMSAVTDSKYMLETTNKDFKNVLKIAKKASKSNVNILILGESGVGKEVIAKFIHNNSDRSEEPFIPVNCHAYSKNILESELFGHEKGAFTGATAQKIGKFENANRGTVFLDEIGELSMDMQVKLLRVIENRTIERVGGREAIKLDFRLISATNKDLLDKFQESFRDDLFYRISTIILRVPPLRNRKTDLPNLISFFIKQSSKKLGIEIKDMDKNVMEYLLDYDYPGNIRELKNIVERLVVLSEDGLITKDTLFVDSKTYDQEGKAISLKEFREDVESKYIAKIIESCDGNITQASKVLNISRRQLHNKINDYGL